MMKIQNRHVDWKHRWIRILKENSTCSRRSIRWRRPRATRFGGHPSREGELAWLAIRSSPKASEGWWRGTESNCRHYDFQSYALPTELPRRRPAIIADRY